MSEINQTIRLLLRSTALGIAERDKVPAGVLHVISARDLVLGALMQEFNSAMVDGLSADEPQPVAGGEIEPPAEPSAEILIGSDLLPSSVEITPGQSTSLGDIVSQAHAKSGLSADEWNALSSADRESLLFSTLDEMKAAAEPETQVPATEGVDPDPATVVEAEAAQAGTATSEQPVSSDEPEAASPDADQPAEENATSRRKRGSA